MAFLQERHNRFQVIWRENGRQIARSLGTKDREEAERRFAEFVAARERDDLFERLRESEGLGLGELQETLRQMLIEVQQLRDEVRALKEKQSNG